MDSNTNLVKSMDTFLLNCLYIIWKEKIIVLLTTAAFLMAAHFYHLSKPKLLTSEIIINDPPFDLFQKYQIHIEDQNQNINKDNLFHDYLASYIISLKNNLSSADNFSQFIHDDKIFKNFFNNLKSKNIREKTFFKNSFKQLKIKNNLVENTYLIEYGDNLGLNGQLLLNSYVEFTVKKILNDYKQRLKNSIIVKKKQLDLSYNIAAELNIISPANQMNNLLKSFPIIASSNDIYMMGTKVIKKYILNYERLISELDKENFDYKYILDEASKPVITNSSRYTYLSTGFILGLIFSYLLIFIKKKIIKE